MPCSLQWPKILCRTLVVGSVARVSDVLSLIEMGTTSRTVLQQEPTTMVLHDKLLAQRERSWPAGHGNYTPALEEAKRLLDMNGHNPNCTLMLLFLSDGVPSDRVPKGPVTNRKALRLCET